MPAKPTEEEIRAVVETMEGIIAKTTDEETKGAARKVKDVLLWVLGDESSRFGQCVDKMNACDEDELSHSE